MLKKETKFIKYDTKKEFLDKNLDILLKNEAQNEVLLGIVNEHEDVRKDNWLLGRVETNKEVQIIFIVDDEREGLVLYFPTDNVENNVIEFFIDNLLKYRKDIKQMLIPTKFNEKIVDIYTRKTQSNVFIDSNLDIYVIEKMKEGQALDSKEKLVKLDSNKADLENLMQVIKNIYSDIYKNDECDDETAEKIVNIYLKKGIYVLTNQEESEIYSHAVTIRKQINGCTLGAIATPKEYRGMGYGKKFIYNLCKKLLEEGNKFIVLQIARQNYVARLVYERIGFKKVSELVKTYFY